MKRPTAASLKKVTTENLAGLGAERLAEILVAVAATRPDLKRRLRMELAAEQGPEHLVAEIDKRLASLESSRGKILWRQKPSFIRDLDALRGLISERLAALDLGAAVDRLWQLMATARPISYRFKDRDGSTAAVFSRGAADLGRLMADYDPVLAADRLVEAIAAQPSAWGEWLPSFLQSSPAHLAATALPLVNAQRGAGPVWTTLIRQLADAAGDVDAFQATYTSQALETPSAATEVGRCLLSAGRVEAAGAILRAAGPKPSGRIGRVSAPDFDWESVWIDYLDRAGEAEAAQAVRWASFQRTLSIERAKAFTSRLSDFADVEAEGQAFDFAARHADFERGLRFLMTWPALAEAARMILARPDEAGIDPDTAEAWAAKLRIRQPRAAHLLLRKAAAAAFRRRDFKTCDRLTQEADTFDAVLDAKAP
jgi:hypothetical protein